MAKARTSRPTPAATEGRTELEFIADRLIERVWQGDEAKRGLATQAASVALAAIQDHTAARYMEGVNENWFDGRDLMNFWMNREMLREAKASVALDGETRSVEGPPPGFARTVHAPEKRVAGDDSDFHPEAGLLWVPDEDRELLDRLAQKDGDELPDSAPKLVEVAKRERRFERIHERTQQDPVWRKEDSDD